MSEADLDTEQVVTVCGAEITCRCGNSKLVHDHTWSDGMTRHHWYMCMSCQRMGAAISTYKDEVTSTGPFIRASELE